MSDFNVLEKSRRPIRLGLGLALHYGSYGSTMHVHKKPLKLPEGFLSDWIHETTSFESQQRSYGKDHGEGGV